MEILKDRKRTNPVITFHEAGCSFNVKRTTTITTNKQINKPDKANLGKIALIDRPSTLCQSDVHVRAYKIQTCISLACKTNEQNGG